jgi:uridine kinase
MTAQQWESVIIEGLHGLPADALAEVADFVLFLRKKTFEPAAFADERRALTLRKDLGELRANSAEHLEEEVAGYEQRYPRE